MLNKIREYFSPPLPADNIKSRIANHVFLLSRTALMVLLILLIAIPFLSRSLPAPYFVLLSLIPLMLIVMALIKKGYVQFAGAIYTVLLWAAVNYSALGTGGIRAAAFAGNLVVLLVAAVLINIQAVFLFGLASSVLGLWMAVSQIQTFPITAAEPVSEYTAWITQTAFLALEAGILYIATDAIKSVLTRALQAAKNARETNQELVTAYEKTLEGWARGLDLRNKDAEGHSRRVTELAKSLAIQLGLSQKDLTNIQYGSMLHDVGKMGIAEAILNKSSAFTAKERKIIKTHPTIAFNLLRDIEYLREAVDIPYCHHERWNGDGYPNGLKGENIPLFARIFAIVEVWDALRHDRSYREAWTTEKVIAHIRERSGDHFDPRLVEIFLKNVIMEDG